MRLSGFVSWNWLKRLGMGASVVLLLANLGCETLNPGGGAAGAAQSASDYTSDILNVGDKVRVIISDIPSPPTPIDQAIPDNGKLVLHLNKEFQFAGKKRDLLEKEIRQLYIDQGLYNNIVVNIEVLPRPVTVGGEVRTPGTLQHHTQMTLTRAIYGAGGFAEFADKKRVVVTRLDGRQVTVNCVKALRNPASDIKIFPGDQIHVPRGIF